MQKAIKRSGGVVLALLTAFLVYALIPRVPYTISQYGKALPVSGLLSTEEVDALETYITDTANNAQAVVVIHRGKTLLEVGDTQKPINAHSVRKSIMSLLIGIAHEQGRLRLDETLEELGIDESQTPLTAQEKTATVRDLLMARSGVYLPAEAETAYAANNRPHRGQYQPGEFYFYNNFDFNVLGAILEQTTGQSIGAFMEDHLAKPLGFQDFSSDHVVYNSPWPVPNKSRSDYPVYWIFISARDLAKVGAMVSEKGRWMGRQIVSAHWIAESTRPYSTLDESREPYDAYAYSWLVDTDNQTIWSEGFGGQFVVIDSTLNLTIVQRNFTGNSLLSSGLFLMKKNRDGWRTDVVHLHAAVGRAIDQTRRD